MQPDNVAGFADKVIWMSEHPEELREFSKNSLALAKARFDRDFLAKKLEAVLLSTVDGHQ